MKKCTLSLTVSNRFGVLVKVTTMFSRRGCNIHSLTVCPTHDDKRSRITIVLYDDEDKITQIQKQLLKLEDVKEVKRVGKDCFECEIALLHLTELPKVPDVLYVNHHTLQDGTYLIEAMGAPEGIDALMARLPQETILSLSRSGSTALCLDPS
ncbi:MAG: acetolactate synthase small subunit [Christensenellales bacterium]